VASKNDVIVMADASELKGELGELWFYFRKIHPESTKIFGDLGSFYFALIAEKFEKWTKMKLLSTFQLATLFAKATMHARIFCICYAMT